MKTEIKEFIERRLINEKGDVAILYSPNYGAGWYAWHQVKEAVFDPEIAQSVLKLLLLKEKFDQVVGCYSGPFTYFEKRNHYSLEKNDKAFTIAEQGKVIVKEIKQLATQKWGDNRWAGADQLTIKWIPRGTNFRISCFDGDECIEYDGELTA